VRIGSVIMEALQQRDIVHDWCSEYGEPGYKLDNDDGFIIFGNIWCQKKDCNYTETYEDGTKKIHSVEWHYPRLFAAMGEQGIQFEWYDEWYIDHDNDKAYRTQADSYMWQSSILFNGYDYLTPDDDIHEWVEAVVNDYHRCLPSHVWSDEQLGALGFTEYQCGYENGWYPGQTDDPKEISEIIVNEFAEQDKSVDILYKLQGVGQFDIHFCVFVREAKDEEEANG
jgi:hypothetical protein